MNRVRLYQALYLILIGGGVAGLLALRLQGWALVLTMVLLLVPSRIPGYFWREFYRGKRCIERRELEPAVLHLERFLRLCESKPWIKSLIWCMWGFYTRDIEAMAYLNLGAAHLGQGQVELAKAEFQKAAELDPQFSLAWFNLSVVARIEGDLVEAERLQEKAIALGFSRARAEEVVKKLG